MSLSALDLSTITDEALRSHYRALGDEISRRHELARAPEEVERIGREFCAQGGDPQVLVDSIGTIAQEHAAGVPAPTAE